MMGFIHLLIFINTYENRFSEVIITKMRFSQIRRIQKDFHNTKRFSQMIKNKNKCVQINPR